VLAAVALSNVRIVTAQAPDGAYYVRPDTPIRPPGDWFIIPPDTDIGIPIIGPPHRGDELLDEVIVEVNVILPLFDPPDFRPALCPRTKPPNEDQYTWLFADGWCNLEDPPPSTYTWSWPDAPTWGSFSDGWCDYWSYTVGLQKTAQVTYEVQDVGVDFGTSGFIRVFDAELTFEGMSTDEQSTIEDNPGAFVAKSGPRKGLTLSLYPQDPDDVMPYNFLDGQPHNPPAPYTVSLSAGTGVQIYSEPTGGTPLTDLEWGWKWNVGQGKFIEQKPPTQLYVQPVGAGSGDLNFSLQFNIPTECTQWYAQAMPRADDHVKLTVVDVNLTATDLDGQVYEEDEDNPGAFVHYNVDNDNNSYNEYGAPKHPGGDFLETGMVGSENDLKSLTMSLNPALQCGSVVLARSNGNARVWKNAIKGQGNEILVGNLTKTWDLSDAQQRNDFNNLKSSLYVEGYGGGTCVLGLFYEMPSGHTVAMDSVLYKFIAADCGDQPRTDNGQRAGFENNLPGLVRCEWSCIEGPTQDYNCIAWSIGVSTRWIGAVGPPEFGTEFIDRDHGDPAPNGTLEPADVDKFYADYGFTRVFTIGEADVIYYSGFHAAKKKSCACGAGKWVMFESKCGDLDLIEHVRDQINGGLYGNAVRFYKKN